MCRISQLPRGPWFSREDLAHLSNSKWAGVLEHYFPPPDLGKFPFDWDLRIQPGITLPPPGCCIPTCFLSLTLPLPCAVHTNNTLTTCSHLVASH
jgi:hypothetical protein